MPANTPFRLGKYLLERRIGAGGMGDVWFAHADDRPEPLVVKRLHETLANDRAMVDRFLDELQLLQKLDHPNIVRLLDGGECEGTYFLAMEYVDGLTLQACLRANHAALQPSLAAELVAQACEGLRYAHQERGSDGQPLSLVHRDISPDNLMVDLTGTVRILDFGIARATCTLATTQVDKRRGKLRYMAPEYLRNGSVDGRVDVYALGATLFALCTGRRPFDAVEEMLTLVHQVCRVGLPPATEWRPDLPRELSEIIQRATSIEPADRIESPAALATELDLFLKAHPAPRADELRRLVRVWRDRAEPAEPRPPSLGQLDLTDAIESGFESAAKVASEPTDPAMSISFAHPLDNTVAVRLSDAIAASARENEPTAPMDVRPGEEPSVIVSPELLEAALGKES
ncbi:MAG: serine/threonine-protein kinase [Myxococcales bacterium]